MSNTCERTQSEQKEQAEDSSNPEGIEVLLIEAAGKSFPDPENPDNPMIAPRDYGNRTWSTEGHGTNDISLESLEESQGDAAIESMLDPIEGRPPTGKSVAEIINLFLWMIFSGKVEPKLNNVVPGRLTREQVQVGSEEWNDVFFTRQRIHWIMDFQPGPSIEVSQEEAIEELEEIPVDRNTKEDLHCTPTTHCKVQKASGTDKLVTN